MKFTKKIIIASLMLQFLYHGTTHANYTFGKSFFLGHNGPTALNGLIDQTRGTHKVNNHENYYTFSYNYENNTTKTQFNPTNNLFRTLGKFSNYFSPVGDKTAFSVTVSGINERRNNVQNRYFLLGSGEISAVVFQPERICESHTFNFFAGLDNFYPKLWASVSFPVIKVAQRLHIAEAVTAPDVAAYAANLFTAAGGGLPAYTSFIDALKGDKTTDGVAANNLKYGKVDGAQSDTKVGDVLLTLGYDCVNKKWGRLSLGLLGLLNGAGASKAVYMFEPTFGTQGRHGFGLRTEAQLTLIEREKHRLELFARADMIHVLAMRQLRSYDITRHGVWSRYMLFKEWGAAFGTPLANKIVHGVNFTTLNAKIGIDLLYDVSFLVRYSAKIAQKGTLSFDAGYGCWGHTGEKHTKWIDDITGLYGAMDDTNANNAAGLNASRLNIDGTISGATISSGFPTAVVASANNVITRDLLAIDSALHPHSHSHSLFFNLAFTGNNEWAPFVGVGAGTEIGSVGHNHVLNVFKWTVTTGVSF